VAVAEAEAVLKTMVMMMRRMRMRRWGVLGTWQLLLMRGCDAIQEQQKPTQRQNQTQTQRLMKG
jgi:hypothetical protein